MKVHHVLDLKETYVAKSSRDKGVASGLAAYAFEYADSKNLNVIPTCPFVSRFIRKNPKFNQAVLKD